MYRSESLRSTWLRRAALALGVSFAVVMTGTGVLWAADGATVTKQTAPAKEKTKAQIKAERKAAKAKKAAKAAEREPLATDLTPSAAAKALMPPGKKTTPPTITPSRIDELIAKKIEEARSPVSSITTDEEFVRRVYLDVTGRIPTLEQIRAFVSSQDRNKRAKLIDRLLEQPDFAANLAHYWRDVIYYKASNPNANQVGYPNFELWLSEQFAKNRPWDEITHDIITAAGPFDENGASAFALAQMTQPVEMAGEVSRIFMGVQIQCAQCHDHPSAPWKRDQFHEFAAFFNGVAQRRKDRDGGGRVFEVYPRANVVSYAKPDLKDPTKTIPVTPKFFLGNAKPITERLNTKDRLALVASYIVDQNNPWFARAFVNRTWAALLGEGFYNPIDDMGPGRDANNPEILDEVASQWQKGGYDIRWLYRLILNTKTYQRESRSTYTQAGRTPFAANCPTRLRGDQIFDALADALNLPLNGVNARMVRDGVGGKGKNAKGGTEAGAVEKALAKEQAKAAQGKAVSEAQKLQAIRNSPRNRFNTMFGVDPSTPPDEVLGTIPQALFLMNSPVVNRGVTAANNTMLGEVLTSCPNNLAALEVIYYKVLSRRPTPKEVQICGRYIEMVGNRKEAFEDILWSLINSTEFISRR